MQKCKASVLSAALLFAALASMLLLAACAKAPAAEKPAAGAPVPAATVIGETAAPAPAPTSDPEALFQYTNGVYTDQDGTLHSTSMIQKYIGPETETLVIPDTLGGCPVSDIAGDAFGSAPWLKHLVLPHAEDAAVTLWMPAGTFSGCTKLETVEPANAYRLWPDAFNMGSAQEADFACQMYYCGVVVTGYTGGAEEVLVPGVLAGRPVIGIGEAVFRDNSALKRVTLPEGVTGIDTYAFYGCTSLVSISLPQSLSEMGGSAFYGCTALETIDLPDGVEKMGDFVFSSCAALKSVSLPCGLQKFGSGAFNGCSSLTAVTLPVGLAAIPNKAFCWCDALCDVTLAEGLVSIGDQAFAQCGALSRISLPQGLESIGEEAFRCCYALCDVTLAEGLLSIGPRAFESCKALTAIAFPGSLVSIDTEAFLGSGLQSVQLPGGLQELACGVFNRTPWMDAQAGEWLTLGNDVMHVYLGRAYGLEYEVQIPAEYGDAFDFSECHYATAVIVPEGVARIRARALSGYIVEATLPNSLREIEERAFAQNYALQTLTLPEGLVTIGDSAFETCLLLESVTLPASLETIGAFAFSGCAALETLTFPEGLKSIGGDVISGCPLLDSVVLPASLTTLDYAFSGNTALESVAFSEGFCPESCNYAFTDCTSLRRVTLPGSLPEVSCDMFSGCTSLAEVQFGEGMQSVGMTAFEGCTALKRIELPQSVQLIGFRAFAGCTKLKDITLYEGVFVQEDTFDGCPGTPVFLPRAAEPEPTALPAGAAGPAVEAGFDTALFREYTVDSEYVFIVPINEKGLRDALATEFDPALTVAVYLEDPLTLSESLTIPPDIELHIANGGELTVPAGCTLRVESYIYMYFAGKLLSEGKLVNAGFIEVGSGSEDTEYQACELLLRGAYEEEGGQLILYSGVIEGTDRYEKRTETGPAGAGG